MWIGLFLKMFMKKGFIPCVIVWQEFLEIKPQKTILNILKRIERKETDMFL